MVSLLTSGEQGHGALGSATDGEYMRRVLIVVSDPNTPEPAYTHSRSGTTIARIILVISDIIAIVVREFLPGSDIPHCNNPDGVMYYMIHVPLGIS
jgi:hypothetical protein